MTNEEKWKAVIENDVNYDGRFFYGVGTTKIFCRPSCKSKTPLRSNVVFFDNREQAIEAGYRPCKRCRPDLSEFSPCLGDGLAKNAKEVIDKYFTDGNELKRQIEMLGISKGYLNKLFLQAYGKTMADYLRSLRISKAKARLLEGASVTESAFECGFESISAFYSNFKKETGHSPKSFCRSNLK